MNPKSTVLAICILIIFTACATTPKAHSVDPQLLSSSNLSFIKDGVTTREEVLTKLGKPSAQYENQRILTYRLRHDTINNRFDLITQNIPETNLSSLECPDVFELWGFPSAYSLVLVFGNDETLQKHNLVGYEEENK